MSIISSKAVSIKYHKNRSLTLSAPIISVNDYKKIQHKDKKDDITIRKRIQPMGGVDHNLPNMADYLNNCVIIRDIDINELAPQKFPSTSPSTYIKTNKKNNHIALQITPYTPAINKTIPPTPCWVNSRIFIINNDQLGNHIDNIIKKFWSIDTWHSYLKSNGYANALQVNPNVMIIDVGENSENSYPSFVGDNITSDMTIKNKKDINKISNLIFTPKDSELVYCDLPVYIFCDGSIRKIENQITNGSNARRVGWGCAMLNKPQLTGNPINDEIPRISMWKSAEIDIDIDIPSSDYAEAMGVLGTIDMLKNENPICHSFNDKTRQSFYEKSQDGAQSYTLDCRKKTSDAYRQIVIVCDNVHMLYLISCGLQSLGKIDSDLYQLSKKIKSEINLTNIVGMWIEGHQKKSKTTHMSTIQRLFKNCNDLVDNLATHLTSEVENKYNVIQNA